MSRRTSRANYPPESSDPQGKSDKSRKRRRGSSEDMGCLNSKDGAVGLDDSMKTQRSPGHQREQHVHSPPKKKGKKYKSCQECDTYASSIQYLEGTVSRLRQERDVHRQDAEDARDRLMRMKQEDDEKLNKQVEDAEKANKEIAMLRQNLRSAVQELGEKSLKLESFRQEIEKLEKRVGVLQEQLDRANEQNSNLLNRLSELAGAKLSVGNPNLVDISDENRPTKLAERYNELYDNEWTDAFSVLTDSGDDDVQVINKLRNIFMSVYNECREFAVGDLESFGNNVLKRFRFEENSTEATVLRKQYIDRRKKMHSVLKGDLKSKIENRLKKIISESERNALQKFTDETFDVCMLMCLQDPMVVIATGEPGTKYDANKYKPYTTKGKFVDYIVWPVLRLHEDGPLLGKGIAQGTDNIDVKIEEAKPVQGVFERPQTAQADNAPVRGSGHGSVANEYNNQRSEKLEPRTKSSEAKTVPREPHDQRQLSREDKSIDVGTVNTTAFAVSHSGTQSSRGVSEMSNVADIGAKSGKVKGMVVHTKVPPGKSQKKPAPLKPTGRIGSGDYDNSSTTKPGVVYGTGSKTSTGATGNQKTVIGVKNYDAKQKSPTTAADASSKKAPEHFVTSTRI